MNIYKGRIIKVLGFFIFISSELSSQNDSEQ